MNKQLLTAKLRHGMRCVLPIVGTALFGMHVVVVLLLCKFGANQSVLTGHGNLDSSSAFQSSGVFVSAGSAKTIEVAEVDFGYGADLEADTLFNSDAMLSDGLMMSSVEVEEVCGCTEVAAADCQCGDSCGKGPIVCCKQVFVSVQ